MEANLTQISAKKIIANVLNPRKDLGDIDGLRQSIVKHGLISPLMVRKYKNNGKFEIIAGERRHTAIMAAIKRGELDKDYTVPAIITEADDDSTVQMMFIENLQRKDLSDFEQAEAFQIYLDRFDDPAAVDDLAEQTGLSPQYIRRRASVMGMPGEVLDMWKAGKLLYGHMEQLMRLDTDDMHDMIKVMTTGFRRNMTVAELKNEVESRKANLNNALFDKKAAGCTTCKFSTKTQKALFGDDFKAERVLCMNSKCFTEHQKAFFDTTWKDMPVVKEHQTNGIVIGYGKDLHGIHRETHKLCATCAGFVTAIHLDGTTLIGKACNSEAGTCFKKLYGNGNGAPKDAESMTVTKTINLAKACAEEFLADKLTERALSDILPGESHAPRMRMILQALIQSNIKAVMSAYPENYDTLFNKVPAMSFDEAYNMVNKIALASVLLPRDFSLSERKTIASQFDIDLARDWKITQHFLKRTPKDEIVAMSDKYKVIDKGNEELMKMKKSALIELFLAGKTDGILPDSIKQVANAKCEPRHTYRCGSNLNNDEDADGFNDEE